MFLSSCTTIHTYVPNFPVLKVTEHEVPVSTMLAKCYPGVPTWLKLLGAFPLGCASIDFNQGTCDIYVSSISPQSVLEHERAHCRGGDHFGELQRMLDRYNDSLPYK